MLMVSAISLVTIGPLRKTLLVLFSSTSQIRPVSLHIRQTFIRIGSTSADCIKSYTCAMQRRELLAQLVDKLMRSAGFEPALPSLGSSYLNQAGLTSLAVTSHKFGIIRLLFAV